MTDGSRVRADRAFGSVLRLVGGLALGGLAGILMSIVAAIAIQTVRERAPVTMVSPDGTRTPVKESPTRHVLRGSGELVVQTCRGACDEVRL